MTPDLFPWILLGACLGVVFGAIPGLTSAIALVLALPLAAHLHESEALALLLSIYLGGTSGKLISETFCKSPLIPPSLTASDLFSLAAKARPRRALGIGIFASLVGGLISWAILIALAKPIGLFASRFGPFEMISIFLFAFVLIVVSQKSLMHGLLALFLGMLGAMVGIDPGTGESRFTFGVTEFESGFHPAAVLIGVVAITSVFRLISIRPEKVKRATKPGGKHLSFVEWSKQILNLVRSSAIGGFAAMLPGFGERIGPRFAYRTTQTVAPDREHFGKGADSAIAAGESAKHAGTGGGLVSLIALGIPGGLAEAVLLCAFFLHGFQPGPFLFAESPHLVSAIGTSFLTATLLVFALMWCASGLLQKLTYLPRWALAPALLALCVICTFFLRYEMIDVWIMLGFGAFALLMTRLQLPIVAFALGFVLIPIAEKNLVEGLQKSGGTLILSPVSLTFYVLSLAVAGIGVFLHLKAARLTQKQD